MHEQPQSKVMPTNTLTGVHLLTKAARMNGQSPKSCHEAFHFCCSLQAKDDMGGRLHETRESWKRTGCTITSDGWTSTTNRNLIDALAVSPRGPVFLDAIDTSGSVKDGPYVA